MLLNGFYRDFNGVTFGRCFFSLDDYGQMWTASLWFGQMVVYLVLCAKSGYRIVIRCLLDDAG